MEWLSWVIGDWLTGYREEPMGSPCFMCEAHTNSERVGTPPCCTAAKFTPSPPTPTNTPPPHAPAPTFSPVGLLESTVLRDYNPQDWATMPRGLSSARRSTADLLHKTQRILYLDFAAPLLYVHDLLCEAGGRRGWLSVEFDGNQALAPRRETKSLSLRAVKFDRLMQMVTLRGKGAWHPNLSISSATRRPDSICRI